MKKALSCILVLAMFLSLGIFGGWNGRALADTPEDRVGFYVLTQLIMDEEDYTELLSAAGIVFTLELRADGTGELVQDEDVVPLTWDENNVYDENMIPVPYTYEDGILIMTEAGMVMTFQKTDSAELPERTADVDVDPVGVWVGNYDLKAYIIAEEPELGDLMENALAAITVELREDGTYSLSFDASPMVPALKAALYNYVEQLCEENDMTLEDFEEISGGTVDELIEEAMEGFDLDEINQYAEGEYEVIDGEVLFDGGTTRGIFTGGALIIDVEDFGEVVLTRAGAYGIWIAELDLASFMGQADEGLIEAMKGISLQVVLELRSDMTFSLSIDSSTMLAAVRVAMRGYLETMLEENGMTVEQFESVTGQSLDDLLDASFDEANIGAYAADISGNYELEDGQLVLNADNGNDTTGILSGNTITFTVDEWGELNFVQVYNEDVLAKGEGVMSYADYAAAEMDSLVVIEAYVLDHQSWWDNKITVYAQDADGAYFMYNMACSEKDAALLVPGQKIRVTGYKTEWAGEVEIADASFEFVNGSYQFRPLDVTDLLGTSALLENQNRLISVKGAEVAASDGGAAFLYGWDGSGSDGSDLYFNVIVNGETYTFVVESYLRGPGTDVYETVKGLQPGDIVDLEGFLYWYEGPQPHVISVTVK